jgi:hypothetical protein
MLKKGKFSEKEKADIRTLMKFVGIYCKETHNGEKKTFHFKLLDIKEIEKRKVSLCPECTGLLTYGLTMRLKCPHEVKPM